MPCDDLSNCNPQKKSLSIAKYGSRNTIEIFFYTPSLMIFHREVFRGNYWYKYSADFLAKQE
jgi:hypothetical protein